MELLIIWIVTILKIAFAVVLIIGWYPALKIKSKGGGLFLLKCYIVCLFAAVAMLGFGFSPISLTNHLRDFLFTSDFSLWAAMNELLGQAPRGMSYQVGESITSMTSFQIMGVIYSTILWWFFRRNIQLWYKIWGKESPNNKDQRCVVLESERQ